MKKYLLAAFTVFTSFVHANNGNYILHFAPVGAKGFQIKANAIVSENTFSFSSRSIPGFNLQLLKTDSIVKREDSVTGKLTLLNFSMQFAGIANKNGIYLKLISPKSKALVGEIITSTKAITTNYNNIFSKVIDTTEKYIFNPAYIDNKEWRGFKTALKMYGNIVEDDLEMFALFYLESKKLPFTHFELTRREGVTKENIISEGKDDIKNFSLKEMNTNTVLFTVGSFGGDGKIIDSLMKIVAYSQYKNLIIDVRRNGGGGAGVALELTKYLITNTQPAGAIITRNWMNEYKTMPTEADYSKLIPFAKGSTKSLIEKIPHVLGFYLYMQPDEKIFNGKVYILTDGYTASTSEPFVQGLQLRRNAMVIGEQTAGAVLSKVPVVLGDSYIVYAPMADYITIDGKRLDKVGVQPNIVTKPEDALQKALEIIASSN
jgi:hypothetical protein